MHRHTSKSKLNLYFKLFVNPFASYKKSFKYTWWLQSSWLCTGVCERHAWNRIRKKDVGRKKERERERERKREGERERVKEIQCTERERERERERKRERESSSAWHFLWSVVVEVVWRPTLLPPSPSPSFVPTQRANRRRSTERWRRPKWRFFAFSFFHILSVSLSSLVSRISLAICPFNPDSIGRYLVLSFPSVYTT